MAKFLIGTWPFPGHYFPATALGYGLRERGHEVAFYTSARVCPTIEGEGFTCFPFEQIDEEEFWAMVDERNKFASMRNALYTRRLYQAWLRKTLQQQVADQVKVLATWQPDVIVTDTTMWGPAVVLREAFDVPVAVFSPFAACMLPGPEVGPFGLGLPRPRNWRIRLLTHIVRTARRVAARGHRQAVNELRQQYSLPPLTTSVTEYYGQMPLYLVPSVPEYDYQRGDLPPSVHYIGPCIWNKPSTQPAPTWLGELPHDRPWVLVSEGTANPKQPLVLPAAAGGLADLPLHVIMTTGNRDLQALGLGPVAPNIRAVEWVPFTDVLPQTDVLVTTGGSGQTMAALQAGVPMVVVPTEWDQPENAQRVVEAGAGVRLNPRRCAPARLRDAVEHVLREPAYRENAQRMRAILAQYDGPRRAADLLERLATRQPSLDMA